MTIRTRSILCLIAVIGVFPFVTSGEETSTTSTSTDTPAVIQEVVTAPTDDAAAAKKRERIIELRGRFADGTKSRIKNLLDNVKHRMSATIDRFSRISTRIESRMKKLEAVGFDTKQAHVSLDNARREIALAQTLLARVTDRDVDTIVDDVSPHAGFTALRTNITGIGMHIANAHEALTLTGSILKTAGTQGDIINIHATTTASTTSKK